MPSEAYTFPAAFLSDRMNVYCNKLVKLSLSGCHVKHFNHYNVLLAATHVFFCSCTCTSDVAEWLSSERRLSFVMVSGRYKHRVNTPYM